MIRTRKQAVEAAMGQTRNTVGSCQHVVRDWFNAPSAGDQDLDGDADAVDGWASEPLSARHSGDRNPPVGVPVAFSGGSHGYGHRAITRAPSGQLRSTDMHDGQYAPGITGNCTIADIERHMGLHYLGWSETIDGEPIPPEDHKVPKPPKHTKVAIAHRLVERALIRAEAAGLNKRADALRKALKHLPEF